MADHDRIRSTEARGCCHTRRSGFKASSSPSENPPNRAVPPSFLASPLFATNHNCKNDRGWFPSTGRLVSRKLRVTSVSPGGILLWDKPLPPRISGSDCALHFFGTFPPTTASLSVLGTSKRRDQSSSGSPLAKARTYVRACGCVTSVGWFSFPTSRGAPCSLPPIPLAASPLPPQDDPTTVGLPTQPLGRMLEQARGPGAPAAGALVIPQHNWGSVAPPPTPPF